MFWCFFFLFYIALKKKTTTTPCFSSRESVNFRQPRGVSRPTVVRPTLSVFGGVTKTIVCVFFFVFFFRFRFFLYRYTTAAAHYRYITYLYYVNATTTTTTTRSRRRPSSAAAAGKCDPVELSISCVTSARRRVETVPRHRLFSGALVL